MSTYENAVKNELKRLGEIQRQLEELIENDNIDRIIQPVNTSYANQLLMEKKLQDQVLFGVNKEQHNNKQNLLEKQQLWDLKRQEQIDKRSEKQSLL
jgi:hypothetical protein